MARIYPRLSDSQLDALPSRAEAAVYRCSRDFLDDSWVVIHGQSYVVAGRDGGHRDGEADFVFFSARHGILAVEVKGGGVSYNPADEVGWQSIDRMGKAHKIKDPVAQAKGHKYAILEQLKSDNKWRSLRRRISAGHAVLLPDVETVTGFSRPEFPNELIGGRADLKELAKWLDGLFGYWTEPHCKPLGADGLEIVERVMCHPISVRPLLRDLLHADDKVRIRLTNEQASVLRTLGHRKRAAISGAAGTGKTILAVEKARMLSALGKRVLFLCFNRPLAVTLARQFSGDENVAVFTFHQFCERLAKKCQDQGFADPRERARAEVPRDDYWDKLLPLSAFYAIEELGDDAQFDAVIVDEGQDFGEEYWLPVEMALRSSRDSWLYVFCDENQRLYSRASSFPLPEFDTFQLTRNCRNSKPVHELAYRYYDGEPTDSSGIEGMAPIPIAAASKELQAKQIGQHITKLIHDEKLEPESVGVLITGDPKEDFYDLLQKQNLPRPVRWSREEHYRDRSVLMDTVKRFKGLERDVIFLWVDHQAVDEEALMYVAISRAKSILYIVGDADSIAKLDMT